MKTLFVSILFLFSLSVFSMNCRRHPIGCQIIKNNPKISKSYAIKLSNIIHKYCLKYKIPKHIYTAILMQESAYSLKAMGCRSGLKARQVIDEEKLDESFKSLPEEAFSKMIAAPPMKTIWVEERVCADFGMSQIYYKTARSYGFDINRLTVDLDYSIKAGAIVLKDFMKRYSHKEKDWYTRYNASSRAKRHVYGRLIKRFF